MKSSFLIFLCCVSLSVSGQHRQSRLSVGGEGYYTISLAPALIAGGDADLSSLRIIGGDGGEVPYYLSPLTASYSRTNFEPYKANIKQLGRRTEVLVEVGSQKISSFDIKIKNANVDKSGELSGSNDGKSWYAVKERVVIDGVYGGDSTARFVSVDFPINDYKFYRLTLSDSTSSALNIMAVGRIDKQHYGFKARKVAVEPTSTQMWRKDKHSFIKLGYDNRYPFTQLDLRVLSPAYFNRKITIGGASYSIKGRAGDVCRFSMAGNFDTISIDIFNMDDAPLVVDSISTFVDGRSVVAYLTGDCVVDFGDSKKHKPQYDLSFVAHIPDSLPVVTTVGFDFVSVDKQSVAQVGESWKMWKNILLWVAIALVMAQILRMTLKVARKTESRD